MILVRLLALVLACALVIAGVSFIHPPSAMIAAGLMLGAFALLYNDGGQS